MKNNALSPGEVNFDDVDQEHNEQVNTEVSALINKINNALRTQQGYSAKHKMLFVSTLNRPNKIFSILEMFVDTGIDPSQQAIYRTVEIFKAKGWDICYYPYADEFQIQL